MKSEWKVMRAEEFIEFNPRLSIKKGETATKVSMDKLKPFTKHIDETEKAAFTGGSKFCNGDTIMARITPCLENGKTAFVDVLDKNEVAFGSTEFIVMRSRKGISDPQFVYYLAISPEFRNVAIKSMVGSSGRQRVQQDVLNNVELSIPPLGEQEKIGAFLAALDNKIALNNKINNNLEQQVYTLFESYFIDLDKTNGIIPDDWHEGTLGDIAFITSGKRPPVKQSIPTKEAAIPLVGAAAVMGYTNSALYQEPILITGRVGTHGVVQRFQVPCWPSDNTLVIKSNFYEYTYQVLKRIDYKNMNRGSTQPLITQTDLKNKPITIPSKTVLTEFEKIAEYLMALYESNRKENEKLTVLRDTLLPKLMSGEIELDKI